eukprot:246817_1
MVDEVYLNIKQVLNMAAAVQKHEEMKSNTDDTTEVELCMMTVKGLEKYAQREIQDLLQPTSMRIIPGIIVATFNVLSSSLLKQMRLLRSVGKIFCLVGEHCDVPLKKSDIQLYLDTNVCKITTKIRHKWETAYKCWKDSCCNDTLFVNNASIPNKTRRRFEKEINKTNANVTRDKLHAIEIDLSNPVYRSKCDRKGQHEWSSLLIEREIAAPLHDVLGAKVNLKYYDIELYCLVRDRMMLYGISIVSDLNVRNRISLSWSTILNNNICYLVGQLAGIKEDMVVWDPMCGVGSTVIEWRLSCPEKNVKYIGSDINEKAIKQAVLNAQYCQLKVNESDDIASIEMKDCDKMEFYTLDICEVTTEQMSDACVDIIISDLPFGHRCGSHKKNRKMYPLMLRSMNRVLKMNGKAMLITMERKLLAKLLDESDKQWKYDTVQIDVGGFDALLFIIHKMANYSCEEKREDCDQVKDTDVTDNNGCADSFNDYRKMSLDSQ